MSSHHSTGHPEQRAGRIACGVSQAEDPERACHEVLEAVAPAMAGETDLAVVFFSREHVSRAGQISSIFQDHLAPGVLIGSSAISVLGNDVELESEPGVACMAASWPGVTLEPFFEGDLDWPGSADDPALLRKSVHDSENLRAIMLLADPFTPLVRLLPALSTAIRRSPDLPSIPIFGGVASAGIRPGENRFLYQDQIRLKGIVGLSISGPIRVDTIVSQGCRPIGRPLIITKASRNIIEGLGGKAALEALQETLFEMSPADREKIDQGLYVGRVVNEYQERFGRGDFLIRQVVGVDRDRGFLVINDFVRVGQTIQFQIRDQRTATEDLELLLTAQQIDDPPMGGLLFTCNGRGSNLFDARHHDVRTIRRALPDLPLAGFFAAGEIGPVGSDSFLHGHTASLAVFRSM